MSHLTPEHKRQISEALTAALEAANLSRVVAMPSGKDVSPHIVREGITAARAALSLVVDIPSAQ